jgi:hypothetical protein
MTVYEEQKRYEIRNTSDFVSKSVVVCKKSLHDLGDPSWPD